MKLMSHYNALSVGSIHTKKKMNNEDGSTLLLTLLILSLVLILGIFSLTTTDIELRLAGNERLNKKTFYAADGGTEVCQEILELNIACPSGFSSDGLLIGNAFVVDKDFWLQETEPAASYPSDDDSVRDIRIPNSDAVPHTNITVFGNSELSPGSALQMAAGYEGLGKAAAAGGVILSYDIYAQHLGDGNSESVILSRWRHVVGQEGSCLY
jgi:hypothetical protein